MRIAIVAPPWLPVPPRGYGGTESVIDRLARGLDAAGHDVLLYTTGDSTCAVNKEFVYEGARSQVIGLGLTELRHLLHAYDAVKGYDVVHDHTVLGPVYCERYAGLPVVTTNHGPFTDELSDVYRSIAGRVPIIAISQHQASTAGDIPISRVIHHGVDPEAFPVGDGRGGYLAFLGRMAPGKGVREAAEIARAAGVPLKIAAKMREPAERRYFATQVRPLLGGDVEYVGELAGPDKLRLLADAVALLNPIQWPEPFGLVMVEALACGTPVITTPRGAAPEIVEDGVTGLLSAETADLVAAVTDVGALDRRACRRSVEERFSTQRMVESHLAFYEEVLAAG